MASFLRRFTTSASAAKTPLSVPSTYVLSFSVPQFTNSEFSPTATGFRGNVFVCDFHFYLVSRPLTSTYPLRTCRVYQCPCPCHLHLAPHCRLPPRMFLEDSSTSPSTRNQRAESSFAYSMTWCRARRRISASSRRASTVSDMQRVHSIG